MKKKKFGYDWTLTVMRPQLVRAARECLSKWDWADGANDEESPLCWKIAEAMRGEVVNEMNFEALVEKRGREVALRVGANGEYYHVWIPASRYLSRHKGEWRRKGGFPLEACDIVIREAK